MTGTYRWRLKTPPGVLLLTLLAAVVLDEWWLLPGVIMIIPGLLGATPSYNLAAGGIVFLVLIIAMGLYAFYGVEHLPPYAAIGVVTWLGCCTELLIKSK